MGSLRAGDVVSRRKGLVMHKGLVLPDGRVLHNTPGRGEHVSSVREFGAGRRIRVERSVGFARAAQALGLQPHLQPRLQPRLHPRLQPRLQPRAYHLFRNNCEHTVHRASDGRARSPQLKGWIAGVGIAAVALALSRHPGVAVAGFELGRRFVARQGRNG